VRRAPLAADSMSRSTRVLRVEGMRASLVEGKGGMAPLMAARPTQAVGLDGSRASERSSPTAITIKQLVVQPNSQGG